jgi:hypothetical protein
VNTAADSLKGLLHKAGALLMTFDKRILFEDLYVYLYVYSEPIKIKLITLRTIKAAIYSR